MECGTLYPKDQGLKRQAFQDSNLKFIAHQRDESEGVMTFSGLQLSLV